MNRKAFVGEGMYINHSLLSVTLDLGMAAPPPEGRKWEKNRVGHGLLLVLLT